MHTRLITLLTLAAFPGHAPGAHAHVGDEIYPFFELLDEDMARIDLTDGSVDDWLEVIGEPSLAASDFYWWGYEGDLEYDPSEVDLRIWLAWHQGSSTLWIAMERFDNLYFNLYDGDKTLGDATLGLQHPFRGRRRPLGWALQLLPREVLRGVHSRGNTGGQPSGPAVGCDR